METLIALAPMAALLAAFAYWIDRRNGKRIAAVSTRIDDLSTSVDARFAVLSTSVDARLAALSTNIDSRFAALSTSIDSRFADVNTRIDDMRAENREAHAQIGKNVDRLRDDVRADLNEVRAGVRENGRLIDALMLRFVPDAVTQSDPA